MGIVEATSCNTDQTVFIVDDDDAVRDSLGMLVESVGLKAQEFSSATEFLDSYQNTPGVLVLDVRMPGMSGWQLTKKIKGQYPKLKIAVLTGWGSDVPNEKKERHGVSYIMGKPVDIQQLQDLLNEVLQTK